MAAIGTHRTDRVSSEALGLPRAAGPLVGLLVGPAIALFFAIHSMVTR